MKVETSMMAYSRISYLLSCFFSALIYSPAAIAQTSYVQRGVLGKTAILVDSRFSQRESDAVAAMIMKMKSSLFRVGYGEDRLQGVARSCTMNYSSASNTRERLDEFARLINEPRMLTPQHWRQRRLYIIRYYSDSNPELANAYLGRGTISADDFEIKLNAAKFQNLIINGVKFRNLISMSNDQFVQAIKGGAGSDTISIFAGAIFHEMLHNVGHDHPGVSESNMKPAIGNFVYEAGWCVARGGTPKTPGTLGLTWSGVSSGFFVD
jgi:hypothetical protein